MPELVTLQDESSYIPLYTIHIEANLEVMHEGDRVPQIR
jgi:hypothetical protein